MSSWLGNCCYMCVYYSKSGHKYCDSRGPYDYCSDFVVNDAEFPEVDDERKEEIESALSEDDSLNS